MSRRSRIMDEALPQDLTEIENGTVAKNCLNCGLSQVVLVKVVYTDLGPTKLKNKIGVCTNLKCFRGHNLVEIPSWVPENTVIIGNYRFQQMPTI